MPFFYLFVFVWSNIQRIFGFLHNPSSSNHFRTHHSTKDITHQLISCMNMKNWKSTPASQYCSLQPNFKFKRRVLIELFARSDHDCDNKKYPLEKAQVTGVTIKMAFDSSPSWGVADLSEKTSARFTSPASLDMVHRLRRESSAILVGRGTVERDNCTLTVRRVPLYEGQTQPVRVVLDPSLRLLHRDFALFNDGLPTLVYHATNWLETGVISPSDMVEFVEIKCSTNEHSSLYDQKKLSPSEIVKDLASRGLHHIMVEGGPTTARAFFDECIVDRAILIKAPIRFESPLSADMNMHTLTNAGLHMIGTTLMEGDHVEYWTKNGVEWPNFELSQWP